MEQATRNVVAKTLQRHGVDVATEQGMERLMAAYVFYLLECAKLARNASVAAGRAACNLVDVTVALEEMGDRLSDLSAFADARERNGAVFGVPEQRPAPRVSGVNVSLPPIEPSFDELNQSDPYASRVASLGQYLPAFPPAYTYKNTPDERMPALPKPRNEVAQLRREAEASLQNILIATGRAGMQSYESDARLAAGALYATTQRSTWTMPPPAPVKTIPLGPSSDYVRSVELSRWASLDAVEPDEKAIADRARAEELLRVTYAQDLVVFETVAEACSTSKSGAGGAGAAASQAVPQSILASNTYAEPEDDEDEMGFDI